MAFSKIEKIVLEEVQRGLLLTERPFQAIAKKSGLSEDGVVTILKKFKNTGVIRRIGGSFDSRKLGFSSTLVGVETDAARLDYAAGIISKLPGVTHCYERTGPLNLWFTLSLKGGVKIRKALERLKKLNGVRKCLSFPAQRIFKLRTFFACSNTESSAKSRKTFR